MKKALGIAIGVALAFTATVALAGRNSGGTYTLPAGNPVQTGTTITSTWANSTLGDLATETTNSLDRTGRGGMLGPLRLRSGLSASAPDLSWSSETTSGLYRNGAGDFRFSLSGSDKLTLTSAGLLVAGKLSVGTGAAGGDSGATWPLSVFQRVQALAPAPGLATTYPWGHDLWLMARGSADLHLDDWAVVLQSNDAITATVTRDIDVTDAAAKLCPAGGTTNCENQSGYTSNLCPQTSSCSIWIDYGTAVAELLGPSCAGGNACWVLKDPTHLTVTTNKDHSSHYKITQVGSMELGQRIIHVNSNGVSDSPIFFEDKRNYPIMQWTNDAAGTWPKSSVAQFMYPISGGVVWNFGTSTAAANANGDLQIRDYSTSACLKHLDYTGNATLSSMCEVTQASGGKNYQTPSWQLQSRNTTDNTNVNAFRIQGSADAARVYGSGTSTAAGGTANDTGVLIFYPNQLGADHNGQFQFHSSSEDANFFTINTAAGGSFQLKGNVQVQAAPTYTHGGSSSAGNPGNFSVAGTSTLTGNTTVGGTLGVTGATTLSSTLGVTGSAVLSNTLEVTGNTTLASNLQVNGTATITGGITGAVTADGFHCTSSARCGGLVVTHPTGTGPATYPTPVVAGCRPICSQDYAGGAEGVQSVACHVSGTTLTFYLTPGSGTTDVTINFMCI